MSTPIGNSPSPSPILPKEEQQVTRESRGSLLGRMIKPLIGRSDLVDLPTLEPSSPTENPKSEIPEVPNSALLSSQYGNKATNLFILDRMLQGINGVTAKIPSFKALSHESILALLKNKYSNFNKDWQKFVALQKDKNALTSEGKAQLEKIRTRIEKAFKKSSLKDKEVQNFLKTAKGPLMVRSTGLEDTEQGAMAGANKSIAGVDRADHEVLAAIGSVVASYFSDESLAQRVLAGKDITAAPFIPVLLQNMIGEDPAISPASSEILSCGVCYTQELGGGTPNLTMIEASYGHNEGVVNGSVKTDVYYVYPTGPSHEIIVEKKDRLVPQKATEGENRFVRKSNTPEKATSAALPHHAQQKLQKISQAIQDHYKMPMDIEWVYNPTNDTFFIVQARPIKQKTAENPRCLNKERLLNAGGQWHKGEKIVGRGGRDVVVTLPEQIVKANSLEDALHEYLAVDQKCRTEGTPNPIRVVVVNKPGGELSHAACVFHENNILVYNDPSFSKENLTHGRAAIFQLQGEGVGLIRIPKDTPIEKHLEGILEDGWKKHPIPGKESLKDLPISEETFKELYETLLKGHSLTPHANLKEIIANLPASQIAVKDLVFLIAKYVQHVSRLDNGGTKRLLPRLHQLLMNVMVIAKDVLDRTDPLQRLHAAKRLEALFMQEGSPLVLNSDSLKLVMQELKEGASITLPKVKLSAIDKQVLVNLENKAQQALQTTDGVLSPLNKEEKFSALLLYKEISKYALTEETKLSWQKFTDTLVASGSKVANRLLIDMLMQLEDLGMLADWMNGNFAKSAANVKSMPHPLLLLQGLRKEFANVKPILKQMQLLQNAIGTWNTNPSVWENPTAFDALWNQFERDLVVPLKKASQNFIANETKLSSFEKTVYLRTIMQGVEAIDKSIKSLKSSPQYSQDEIALKVKRFVQMLKPYKDLTLLWFDAVPKESFKNWTMSVCAGLSMSLDRYRDLIRNGINEKFEELSTEFTQRMLYPSRRFNVQAATISSGADFLSSFIDQKETSLEDCFTLFHQNILAALGPHQDLIPVETLPPQLAACTSNLLKINSDVNYMNNVFSIKSHLLSIDLGYPQVSSKLNIPIKMHAAVMDVKQNLITGEVHLDFQMFGHNLGNRMTSLVTKIILDLIRLKELKFSELPHYDENSKTLNFSLNLSKNFSHFEDVAKAIREACQESLKGNFGDVAIIPASELAELNDLDSLLTDQTALNAITFSRENYMTDLFKDLCKLGKLEEAVKLAKTLGVDTSQIQTSPEEFYKNFSQLIIDQLLKGIFTNALPVIKESFSSYEITQNSAFPQAFGLELLKHDILAVLDPLLKSETESSEWTLLTIIRILISMDRVQELQTVLQHLMKKEFLPQLSKITYYLPLKLQELPIQALSAARYPGFQATKEDLDKGMIASKLSDLKEGSIILYQQNKNPPVWLYGKCEKETLTDDKPTVKVTFSNGQYKWIRAIDKDVKLLES